VTRASPPLGAREPQSPVDPKREAEACDHARNNRRDVALKILMVIYGDPLAGFIARLAADSGRAKAVYHDVFLAAFRGLRRFEHNNHASMWAWLCQITYERLLEEEERVRPHGTAVAPRNPDNFDVGNEQGAAPTTTMDGDRTWELETHLARLPVRLRAHLLMRFSLGLSYAEIGKATGVAADAAELNISQIQSQLRRSMGAGT
jgi:RNA polymerase sigma factor CnrH